MSTLQDYDKSIITYSKFKKSETKIKSCIKCQELFVMNKFHDGIIVNGKIYYDCPYCTKKL